MRRESSVLSINSMAEAMEEVRGPIFVVFVCCTYIACSALTISFNKYLMVPGHFPYALALALIQMLCSTIFSSVFYKVSPASFPSLSGSDGDSKFVVDRRLILTSLAPISALFGMQLLLANAVYQHLSIAFIQMMKMANVVFVYALSVMVCLDKLSLNRATILILIVLATSVTVEGERHFSMRGFVLQAVSQIFGCSSLVLQGTVLTQGRGKKLDVMTYNLLISPMTLCMLTALVFVSCTNLTTLLQMPTWKEVMDWLPFLVLNAMIVYGLNIGMTMLVKHTSPVGLCLAGMLKDGAVVLSGVGLHGEYISKLQAAGFLAQLGLIYTYANCRRSEETAEKAPESESCIASCGDLEGPRKKSKAAADSNVLSMPTTVSFTNILQSALKPKQTYGTIEKTPE